MNKERLITLLKVMRVNQWIKNLVVFTAIIFSAKLFEWDVFVQSFNAFIIFCFLSSTSYILNDIIDFQYDKKHPVKKNRPIASGKIAIPEATFFVFILTLACLVVSLFVSISFFLLSLVFILLHFFYSLYLKKHAVIDIFTISFSFMLRTFAGEVATGFHIPIWLHLTIFFGSLFIATVKRHAEYVTQGTETRISMSSYREHLLDFLSNTFATATIIAYAFYTYFEKIPHADNIFTEAFLRLYPDFEARKWMMITIPFVVYGIARYAQLLYEKTEGERPEKVITTDTPLMVTIGIWGFIVVLLIYVF